MLRFSLFCVAALLSLCFPDLAAQSVVSFSSLYTFIPTLPYSCGALYVDTVQSVYCILLSSPAPATQLAIKFSTSSTGTFSLLQTYNTSYYTNLGGGKELTVDSSGNLYTYFSGGLGSYYVGPMLVKFNAQGKQNTTFSFVVDNLSNVFPTGLATDNSFLYMAASISPSNTGGGGTYIYRLSLNTGSVLARVSVLSSSLGRACILPIVVTSVQLLRY